MSNMAMHNQSNHQYMNMNNMNSMNGMNQMGGSMGGMSAMQMNQMGPMNGMNYGSSRHHHVRITFFSLLNFCKCNNKHFLHFNTR